MQKHAYFEANQDTLANTTNSSVVIITKSSWQLAINDIKLSIKHWRFWTLLAWQDIRLRYRRSYLGPFWITLSMAITIYSMGFLYAHLFRTKVDNYFAYLAAGMISWQLISSIINETTETFVQSAGFITQFNLPYTAYIHRVVYRDFIIFFHNLAIMIPIFILFHSSIKIDINLLLIVPALVIAYFNACVYGTALAVIGVRYRDFGQIVQSIIQVIFFITPIMWNPSALPEKLRLFVSLNPLYPFIELIRSPLIGMPISASVFKTAGLLTLIGILLSAPLFSKFRSRIVYWT